MQITKPQNIKPTWLFGHRISSWKIAQDEAFGLQNSENLGGIPGFLFIECYTNDLRLNDKFTNVGDILSKNENSKNDLDKDHTNKNIILTFWYPFLKYLAWSNVFN